MGWQQISIFLPEDGEPSPFLYNEATGKTVRNPKWKQPVAEPERLSRLDTVLMLTGLSRATLWRMEREGRFPKRQKIGKRAVAWRETEVRAWIAKRSG
jgi:prophage regulatory protein